MRPLIAAFAIVLATVPVLGADAARPGVAEAPSQRAGAAEAVSAGLDVERTLLKEDLEAWTALARRRDEASGELDAAHDSLDAAIRPETAVPLERLESLMARVESQTRALDDLVAAERDLLDLIRERRRKIVLLEEKVNSLLARASEAGGPMAGSWDISLLPAGQRGRLFLSQTGTIVTGTYVLDGGYSGSVQGTFVNRKLVLERIDARLGRWGRLEGSLSPDGVRVRGTWLRLELAGGDGGEGQWTAVRTTSQP